MDQLKTTSPAKIQHIEYIDVLRVLSMISVVFLHTAAGSLRDNLGSPIWHLSNVLTAIMGSSVPLFFMISGAMLLDSDKTLSLGYTYKKRLPKALVPFLVFSILAIFYFAALGYVISDTVNWKDALSKLKNITSQPTTVHLWFMYALIPLYLLSPLLKKLVDALSRDLVRYLLLLWVIFASFLPTLTALLPAPYQSLFAINPSYNLNFLNGYLGYFILGYYLFKNEKHYSKKLLAGIILLDTVIISLGTWLKTSQIGQYSEIFKSYTRIFTLILSVAIFLFVKELLRDRALSPRWSGIVNVLSAASFGIYLVHNLLVDLISRIIKLWPAQSLLVLFGGFLAVLIVSLGCMIVAASLKPFCFIFTGLTYKKACESMNLQYFFKVLKNKRQDRLPGNMMVQIDKRSS